MDLSAVGSQIIIKFFTRNSPSMASVSFCFTRLKVK